MMTKAEQLTAFAINAAYEDISKEAIERIKCNVLDTIGCALGSLDSSLMPDDSPIPHLRKQLQDFGGPGNCTLIGGSTSTPITAAFNNGAHVRYLDFMDNYMGKKQSCHPCDTFSAVLAASEMAHASGREFMTSLAVAYQVYAVLIDHFPVQERGLDHTVQMSIAIAAACSRALGMTVEQGANAIALVATSIQGTVEVRSDYLSQWKGLASAFAGMNALHLTLLAKAGITGPKLAFEGVRGLEYLIGEKLDVDWKRSDLERVRKTSIKKFNAEIHSQSAIEGMLELREEHKLEASDIDEINIEIFRQANNIIGEGSESGHKQEVFTKEQADHSLFYLLSVAVLDGEVTPKQFLSERINRRDVQELLKRVTTGRKSNIGLLDSYTNQYPDKMPCKITVKLRDGKELVCEKKDYEGFFARPLSWDQVAEKFNTLSANVTTKAERTSIETSVQNLDKIDLGELTRLMGGAKSV